MVEMKSRFAREKNVSNTKTPMVEIYIRVPTDYDAMC